MLIQDEPSASANHLCKVLIGLGETHQREFKRVSGKMVGKALETVCALANADGGVLVLGLADLKEFKGNARLFGIDENPEAIDELLRTLATEFQPAVQDIRLMRLACSLHNGPQKGREGHLLLVQVGRSRAVHSIIGGGTYTRLEASNRQMAATEVTELSYRRGVRSAASEPVPVALERLQTDAWRRYVSTRGIKSCRAAASRPCTSTSSA